MFNILKGAYVATPLLAQAMCSVIPKSGNRFLRLYKFIQGDSMIRTSEKGLGLTQNNLCDRCMFV